MSPTEAPPRRGCGCCLLPLLMLGITGLLAVGGLATLWLGATAPTAPPPDPDEVRALQAPWPSGLVAGAEHVATGGSTRLRLDVVTPEGVPDRWTVRWQASCGVIAPDADRPTQALFLAPLQPGWCRVRATLSDPIAGDAAQTLDLAVLDPTDGAVEAKR